MTRPLDGVKVVDLSNMLMAPYATQILGDMGADVIKVEAPGGDPIRGIGPLKNPGMGAIFLNVNRSKRSITLDLKHPDGRAAALDLIRDADVVVYNLRPQVMARLGLSYEAVSEINPRVIYAGLFGYGQDGPYAHKPAFDDLIQGAAAIPWLAHMADGSEPSFAPTAIIDRGVALWAVGQINAALFHMARTGQGQSIDVPMFEFMASFVLSDHLAGHTFDPPTGPMGYPRMLNADRRPYKTKDGYVCVMVYTDKQWRSFFKALGREADFEADPRLQSMTTRTENIKDIYRELAEIMSTRTSADWLKLLDDADIPSAPLHTLETLIADPHLEATEFFSYFEHPSEGRLRDMAVPSRWSKTQPKQSRHPPSLGEHSAEVLRELGYSDERIATLFKNGVSSAPPEIPATKLAEASD
ncbi:MAG: CoA transferase [Rhodospirillaceae bacterium]|nr:CoA transferase [Rhodospirillaceae bacterium]